MHRAPQCVLLLLAWGASWSFIRVASCANAPSSKPVKVILWFDTEDYLLKADDDADKRLAEMLTARHIRATFKVVGEKARVLEQRGRQDVITAMKQHDIGYHSNLHSVHPAPTEYLADCGFLDGVDEFVRREARGAADVRRIFNVPTLVCYGQPGSSWASQAIAALPRCGVSNDGIPCYLDSGSQIGLGGTPFWYCGALNVYDMRGHETRMDLFNDAEPLQGDRRFDELATRLTKEGGGLISIYYHPCEFVQEEFWDKVNFARGENPPREEWKPEPQKPAAETEKAFERFGQYLDHLAANPGVVFITASQLPRYYPDHLREDGASPDQVLELARRITDKDSKGIGFQSIGNKVCSPADQFALLATVVDRLASGEAVAPDAAIHVPKLLLGPDGEPPPGAGPAEPLRWPAFRDAVHDADDFVQAQHRIPARVFIGPDAVSPADFLFGMAAAYIQFQETHRLPASVTLGKNVRLLTADYVVKSSPRVYGGWIIHRENFEAPHVLEIARLQAWTLKPATPWQSTP